MTNEADAAAGNGGLVASKKSGKKQQKELSKRQQRKQPSEKNKWPQHPKIQNMQVRHKAYIRVAGLGTSTKKKEVVDPKLDLMSPEVKFGRLLGGTDQRKRHAAVQKLKAYLRARCDVANENGGISELDLLKLWKGLWYTLYMADKVPVQDEVAKHLADLLWCVAGTEEEDEYAGEAYMNMCEEEEEMEGQGDFSDDDGDVILEEVANTLHETDSDDDEEEIEEHEHGHLCDDDCDHDKMEELEEERDDSEIPHCRGAHLASLFIRTFFRTIKREWGNMDKYRVDKFYSLVRMYMHEIFKYMATRHWNLGILRLFNDAMFEEVLKQRPNGLRYHLIDIALDELAKVNAKAPMPLTEATFLDTMEPYFAMCQTGAGGDDTVQHRVLEHVLEKFIEKYSVVSDPAISEADDEASQEAKALVFDQVHVGSVAQFIFELASDPETKDQYRKSLYEMHKIYMRRLKKTGIDVSIAEGREMEAQEDEMSNDGESPAELEEVPADEETREENMEELETPPKKVKKKRKRKEAPIKESIPDISTPSDMKKKKRKNQKGSISSLDADEDEVVTITISDQKKARGKKKKGHKQQPSDDGEQNQSTPERTDKHVKWRPVNRSKSHKASIKALVTATPPKTSQVTPEKGILLNKGKIRRAGVTKKAGRKKAVNYF